MHNQFKTQKFKHLMLAMGPRDLNSAPYSPVHCSSHSMTSFQSSELTELPVVENSQLFAQRAHSARYAPKETARVQGLALPRPKCQLWIGCALWTNVKLVQDVGQHEVLPSACPTRCPCHYLPSFIFSLLLFLHCLDGITLFLT